MLLWLGGCGFGLDPASTKTEDDTATSPDTEDEPEAVEIDQIVPPYGFTDGGQEVVIEGGPFGDEVEVKFGDEEADVLEVTRDTIRVETPEQARAGGVDVEVSGRTGRATLESGFNYFDDGTGQTGIIGEFSWTRYLGDYWQTTPIDSGLAWFSLIAPMRLAHWELYGRAPGYCVPNYEAPVYTEFTGEDPASLSAVGVSAVRLGWSETEQAFVSPLDSSDFLTNTTYDLDDLRLPGFPDIELAGVVRTPPSFSLSSPNLDGAVAPDLGANTTVRWSGANGDKIVVVMGLHNGAGTAYEAVVTCVAEANMNQIDIQRSDWSNWVVGRQVDVYVGLTQSTTATLDFNGASSEFTGVYWLFGAGFSI